MQRTAPHVRALQDLSVRPRDAELNATAAALVASVEQKRQPLKAVAAILRTHRSTAGLSAATVRELTSRAAALLEEQRRRDRRQAADAREYCGLAETARLLGEDAHDIHERMVNPAQRRLLGWPYWDGRGFRFPMAALRAETRNVYLTAQPEREPATVAATLPAFCRQQGQTVGETPVERLSPES